MMIFIYLLCLNQTQAFEIQKLDPLYQIAHLSLNIDDDNFAPKKYFSYGIWSKYNPLSTILQTGPVGIFDSNCYLLHHIIDKKTNELNFIYFDCLDYEANTIKKTIKFINSEEEQKIYQIKIDPFEYESFWYFLEILQWPLQKRFEILIISQSKIIIHDIYEQGYPFKGNDLQFTFGSSLIVSNSRIESINKDQKFSYFPGTIIIQNFKIENELNIVDWFEYVKSIFQSYELCLCYPNYTIKIQDQDIKTQFKKEMISDNQNCDSFVILGWFKIQEILSQDNQFIYPFIKLTSIFENPSLTNDNLSPLQIQYHISDIQNQIIVTTYSYTFPIVSIDLSNNPFLIVKTIDVGNSIKLWHQIQVKLMRNQLDIQIKFYEQFVIHEYSYQLEVHQFQQQQFKLQYGNIQQLKSNYLHILIRNFFFSNCDQTFSEQNCHSNCQECDGPTNEDCLSCPLESKRIYLPEHKACICPYNTIDDQTCIGYEDTNLQFIDEPFISNECKYGYFELDNECQKCPSIIRKDLIICVECLQNPKSFSQDPYCKYDLYVNQLNLTEILQWSYPAQLYFDGNNIIAFADYIFTTINDSDNLYLDFLQKSLYPQFNDENQMSLKLNTECEELYLSIEGVKCKLCSFQKILENGNCIFLTESTRICQTPYYLSSANQCKLCPKINCIYCFEYQNGISDSFKSTLYKNFESFNVEEQINVGCAMCEDGFIYDFMIGECLRQQPKIESCLRSFINQDGIEICTLSSQTDFSIAPEIINCEKYHSNCLQCVLLSKSKVQCIICKEGFISSIVTGNCYESQNDNNENSIYVIQGEHWQGDGYIQLIQSFMMQYLPDQYYYSYTTELIQEFPIKCKNGYQLSKSFSCIKYCSSDCLNCQSTYNNFICLKCPLNYYRKHIIVEILGQCITCSNLCQYCQERTEEEITALNSYFQLQESNAQFLMKCLKPIDDPNIIVNPYLGNVKYCFNESCYNRFSFSQYFQFCSLDRYQKYLYEQKINFIYCNLIGVDEMTINYIFEFDSTCKFTKSLELLNRLKQKIFYLRKTNMILSSVYHSIWISHYQTTILNYDSVEIKNISLQLYDSFIVQNANNKVDITLKNIVLVYGNFSDKQIIQTQVYGNILFQDFKIINYIFINSSFFRFQKQSNPISITIQKLTIKNCILDNSTLFQINNIQATITIENILIENCSIFNSSFFSLQTDLNNINQVKLFDIEINQCNFTLSYFLMSNNKFKIMAKNLFINHNILNNSILIAFDDDIELIRVRTSWNTFIGSSILSTLLIINEQRLFCIIDDFDDSESAFQESSMITIYSSLQINNFIVSLKNIKVQKNKQFNTFYLQNLLFKLHCHSLIIQNAQFLNLQNMVVFYLFEINQIVLESVIFENSQQEHKVPISQFCTDQVQFRSQLLQVIGFQQLSLSNIKILNQFSINYSLIDIYFSNQFIIDQIRQVILVNIQFKGNILLKNKQAISLSLLTIFSQYNLNIKLVDFQLIQNIVHQQIDEPFDTQTNLLHISSLDSYVQIHKLYCNQNALTNSTNPFITLTATFLEISNLIFMNSNMINQQEINQIIQSTFQVLNQGIQVLASIFSCTESVFQEIIALKSSIFSIKTQGQGIIKINKIQIDSVYINLKDDGSTGCISIDSTNSLLNTEFKQIKFTNIFNRMAASLFTISPSLKQNIIELNNIEIKNSLSLMNTIMQVRFSAQVMKQSQVSIYNLSIYSSEEMWIKFFSFIGQITLSELENIQREDNSMLFFEYCNIQIKNLEVEGMVLSPILKFQNVFKLKLLDCKLISINKLYSFDLIHITQTLKIESRIYIEKLKIIQSNTYQQKSDEIPIFQNLNYQIAGCKLKRNIAITQQTIYSDIIRQIQSFDYYSNQIMYVQSISNQNSLIFQQIEMIHNNGSDFSNGIITFEVDQFKIFKINNFFCYQNSVKQNGCIYFLISSFINSIIRIRDSNFIQNIGSHGGAILIQNVRFRMTNCKIISNYASKFGGGLFLQLKGSGFQIKSTIIINNEALQGGGIYFNQDDTINLNNFIKSYLLFNKATQFGDNLIESPHHLALLINNIEMQSKKQIINQILTDHLDLKAYKMIEQGISFYTHYLMIPSNQVIQEYQIYQPSRIQYFLYITHFRLILKNSLNEQLPNNLNTSCILIDKIVQEESLDQIGEQKEQKILQFDSQKDYYDLGSLQFILDPYNSEKRLLQIEISCQSPQQQNNLNYILQTKSLKCQLGEFYINSGCEICQSSQGFYSVVYDATKCSIFDKTKFKNITKNNIELLGGFWRPNFLSDQIEECFKNVQFCIGGWGQGNYICDQGHIGALCEECDIYNIRGDGKYLKNQVDSQCISCFGVQDSIIPFIGTSIWSFISIIITLRSIDQSNQLFKSLKLQQRFSKIIFNLEQGNESFLIKMLLNYLWIYSVIFTFDIKFQFSFSFVNSASNTSYYMTNNLDCYLSENQSIKLIYSKIITMLVLMIFQFMLILIVFLIYNWYKKIGLSKFNLEIISNSLLYLYISNYGGLIKMYFSILSKRDISSQSYIQGDVSLLFGSKEHLIWIFSFVIPGIGVFSLIIPLFLFIVMYIKKYQHDTIKIRKHFCYLINEYNNRSYFWEEIKLIKKTIIILILTYFETYILLKASLLGLCLLFYQLLAFKKKPYILSNFNSMDLFSAQICSITIFLGAVKYVSEQENNQFSSISLSTVIVFLCIKLCYSFIKGILEVYNIKYSFIILNYLHIILNKISQNSILTKKLKKHLQKSNQSNQRLKFLIKKLKQHLLKISKSQIENHRKILNSQSQTTKFQIFEQKYLLKIDTE
ncbi:unnamed protein product [Paramecium sonneborni]|uniref:Transmembrane protein n=1 Tax=Paramecium sonneborni TaxID=65129 RepID=A0A8S1R3T9_9CILI|nr:unnamed protein product [Paramecium sonneborni]